MKILIFMILSGTFSSAQKWQLKWLAAKRIKNPLHLVCMKMFRCDLKYYFELWLCSHNFYDDVHRDAFECEILQLFYFYGKTWRGRKMRRDRPDGKIMSTKINNIFNKIWARAFGKISQSLAKSHKISV